MAGARVDWVQSEQKTEKRNKQCTLPAQWAIIDFSHVRLRTFVGRANIIARGAECQGLRSRTGARSALVSIRCQRIASCETQNLSVRSPRSVPFFSKCCTGAVLPELNRPHRPSSTATCSTSSGLTADDNGPRPMLRTPDRSGGPSRGSHRCLFLRSTEPADELRHRRRWRRPFHVPPRCGGYAVHLAERRGLQSPSSDDRHEHSNGQHAVFGHRDFADADPPLKAR